MSKEDENRFFKMGAVVAVGEMYDSGLLGYGADVEGRVRSFLSSFGVRSMEDVDALGISGLYRGDFVALFGGVR